MHVRPFLKPQLEIDLLTCKNYICHVLAVRRSLLMGLEFDNPAFEGAQDHHLTLQAVEGPSRDSRSSRPLPLAHVGDLHSSQRRREGCYAQEGGHGCGASALRPNRRDVEVSEGERPFSYHVFHKPPATHPRVSILIPPRDHVEPPALHRLHPGKTTYDNYEVLVIENNSELEETFSYYQQVQHENKGLVRVVTWEGRGTSTTRASSTLAPRSPAAITCYS